jgi:hypothetical protein
MTDPVNVYGQRTSRSRPGLRLADLNYGHWQSLKGAANGLLPGRGPQASVFGAVSQDQP